jgi:hypothetical protein
MAAVEKSAVQRCKKRRSVLYKNSRSASHPPAMHRLRTFALFASALFSALRASAFEADTAPVELIVSVADQRMALVREGGWLRKYKISTSRFGIGDESGSYRTPSGRLRVWGKVGGDLPAGAVIKHRAPTGEILQANAPGRDPIVSRILWLEGLEPQNERARARGIYIHGTTEESRIGKPVSWGCIRMRSEDVIELFDLVPVGTFVTISAGDLPHLPKWKPAPPPPIVAERTAPPAPERRPANREVRLASLPAPSAPRRVVLEFAPPVVEKLRPADEQPAAQLDAGIAAAFKGSILFAGLPEEPKPAPRSALAKESR